MSIIFDTLTHAHISFFHDKNFLSLGKLTEMEGFSLGKLTEMEGFSLGKLTEIEGFSLGKLTFNICNLLLFMYIMQK